MSVNPRLIHSSINTTSLLPQGCKANITLDSQGNLYIADQNNHRVRKVDTNGIITTVAGTGENGYNQDGIVATQSILSFPTDVAVDSNDNLYIADRGNHRIRMVDSTGSIVTIAGNGEGNFTGDYGVATEASLSFPTGVDFHMGNLYIADRGNHRIRMVNPTGIITTIAGNETNGFSGDKEMATNASFSYPYDVAVSSDGKIYISDKNNHRIRMVDTSGLVSTIAGGTESGYGGDGGKAIDAKLKYPSGITLDALGSLYIADYGNHRIRKVSVGGDITTVAGNGVDTFAGDKDKATDASLCYPLGVSVRSNGTFYIADAYNGVIRKVAPQEAFSKYGLTIGEYLYKQDDNTADVFDKEGKLIKTINLATNTILTTYTYDVNNKIQTFSDQFGQRTRLEKEGNILTITAPHGEKTLVHLDDKGDLVKVEYEDKSNYRFTYFDGSLMDIMTDPNGNKIYHTFNNNGEIIEEIDGINGSYRFLNVRDDKAQAPKRLLRH